MGKSSSPQKWKTYFTTFSAYVALHAMRMTYSEIKPYFQIMFGLSNLFLGLLDGVVYVSLAIGFGLRFLISSKQIKLNQYLIFTLISILGFLVIPITSLSTGIFVSTGIMTQKVLPIVGLTVFGFFQFSAWPTLLTITNGYFDLKTQGAAMGFWASNANIGNILGFALTGLIIDIFQFSWEIAMIVVAVLQLVIALNVYFRVKEFQEQSNSLLDEIIEPKEQEILKSNYENFKDYLNFIKEFIGPNSNKIFLLINGLLKSILYGFLLWMPLYLTREHLTQFVAIIPIIFNFGTLIGSLILGSLYEQMQSGEQGTFTNIKQNIKKYNLFYSCLVVIACLLTFSFVHISMSVYYTLSAISGFFLGGTFNMLVGNEVIKIVGSKKQNVNYLSTLSMMANNLVTGLSEVIIGYALNANGAQKELFYILTGVAIISSIILFIRTKCY